MFWGETGARLGTDRGVLENSAARQSYSLLLQVISAFLFFLPYMYIKKLDLLFQDYQIKPSQIRTFFSRVKSDWDNSITPVRVAYSAFLANLPELTSEQATVLLSANVGFLAIQSIDTGTSHRSAAQIASYISAILSLFIYVVCQILSVRHGYYGLLGSSEDVSDQRCRCN